MINPWTVFRSLVVLVWIRVALEPVIQAWRRWRWRRWLRRVDFQFSATGDALQQFGEAARKTRETFAGFDSALSEIVERFEAAERPVRLSEFLDAIDEDKPIRYRVITPDGGAE